MAHFSQFQNQIGKMGHFKNKHRKWNSSILGHFKKLRKCYHMTKSSFTYFLGHFMMPRVSLFILNINRETTRNKLNFQLQVVDLDFIIIIDLHKLRSYHCYIYNYIVNNYIYTITCIQKQYYQGKELSKDFRLKFLKLIFEF